jgi:hypothetical protein
VNHARVLPWFWELNDLLPHHIIIPTSNYKDLFLWLERMTQNKNNSGSIFMGIANRRRIWSACEQLAQIYRAKVNRRIPEAGDRNAKAIFDAASSFHMPKTLYPDPVYADTVSAQLIRSWDEISERACDFKTYFNDTRALVGISVNFGNIERLFGSAKGNPGETLNIPAGDWVKEIVVFMSRLKMNGEYPNRSEATSTEDTEPLGSSFIKGLKVHRQRVMTIAWTY